MKAAPGSSQPSSAGTMRRCPLEEIGRNSVSPWTRPRTMASMVAHRRGRLVALRLRAMTRLTPASRRATASWSRSRWVAMLASAPIAMAADGVGLCGRTDDRVVTYCGLHLIVFFTALVIVLSLVQGRLESRKERSSRISSACGARRYSGAALPRPSCERGYLHQPSSGTPISFSRRVSVPSAERRQRAVLDPEQRPRRPRSAARPTRRPRAAGRAGPPLTTSAIAGSAATASRRNQVP